MLDSVEHSDEAFFCQCLVDTLDGLRAGLSHFSGTSRAAVLFAVKPGDPMRIFDPQNLLRGHEPRFEELYLDAENWKNANGASQENNYLYEMVPEENLGLAGLVSYGGRSRTVFFQMWFTEQHPDMCSVGPTECWLEHAAWRFSHDMANKKHLYTGISGFFLREYATHAVRDFLVDRLNFLLGMDSDIRVYPILDAIIGISKTREERAWPRGQLVFVENARIGAIDFMAKFPEWERPDVNNYKHVRKLLLSVENSNRILVSNGRHIVGIAKAAIPAYGIVADYRGGHGFLRMQDDVICSFSDGSYKSSTLRTKMVQFEEALLESDLDLSVGNHMFKMVSDLVHYAETEKHGCTIVVDLTVPHIEISGQKLTDPLDMKQTGCLELARSLTKVDGALHLGRDLKLYGFACLLDGRSVVGEDRSRGARFNSALRFTAEHPDIIVVVVSVDRGVSVIQGGVEISAQCVWTPISGCIQMPPTLEEWMAMDAG